MLVIKAKLEAVTAGISTIETEFLANIVLPDNTTAGEWMLPQIDRAYRTGEMPPLLPAAGHTGHQPAGPIPLPLPERLLRGDRGEIPAVGTGVPLCDNCPGGPVVAREQDGRPHRRPSAVEQPMVERRKPIVTELALADALDQLVNLIEELRADANLRVEITTDETELVKLSSPAPQTWAFPCSARFAPFPPRSFAESGTRASAITTPRTAPATPSDAGHAAARTLRASAVRRNT